MTAPDPLFEFMPYGAPELLAARRPHLVRALVLASALAAAAFGLAHSFHFGDLTDPVIRVRVGVTLDPGPPPLAPPVEPTRPAAPTVARAPLHDAVPVPVPDTDAPPATAHEQRSGDETAPPGDPNSTTNAGARPDVPPVAETPPAIGQFVYTDVMAAAVKPVEPVYPEFARLTGAEGRVTALMMVGKDGRVMKAEIDPKTSNPMFDEAVLAAARQWVFTPALADKHPVVVWVAQTFVFKIHY